MTYRVFLFLLSILLWQAPASGQTEDNFSLAVKYGSFRGWQQLQQVFFDVSPSFDYLELDPSNGSAVFGDAFDLELRYATSERVIFSLSGGYAYGIDRDWIFAELTDTRLNRTFPIDGRTRTHLLNARIGGHYRLLDPDSRFEINPGLTATYSLIRTTQTDRYFIFGEDGGTSFGSYSPETTGTTQGIAAALRFAFRPLPRLGLLIDTTAGVQWGRSTTSVYYYTVQAGTFFNFGGN